MIYLNIIKPLLDRFFALSLIIFFSPLWLIGLILIKLFQGSPICYLQARTGYKKKGFIMYKIRTLEPATEVNLSLENRDYTRLGKLLRVSGADEFPQLLNILKGEMSFVGPRPMPVEYENIYSEYQKKRFECKPGITGWAQVNGRNTISWEDRFVMDIWYVHNRSFWLDLKIFGLTIFQIFKYKDNRIVMPVFTASHPS